MNTTQRVRSILNASRKARNSDKELYLIYMQKSGVNLSQHQIEKIREMPNFESIRRIRQKIQEAGELRADKETEDRRFEKYRQTRGEIGISSPESAEELLNRRGYVIIDE